jgi:enoyl-CoA hydratase/carnithine racemase
MSGRPVKAQEALAIGLVDRVAPADEVHQATLEMVEPFLTGPAIALAAAKQAVERGMEVDLESGLAVERSLFAGLFATEDRVTGMRAFVEHGPGKAQFRGH